MAMAGGSHDILVGLIWQSCPYLERSVTRYSRGGGGGVAKSSKRLVHNGEISTRTSTNARHRNA